MFIEAIDKLRCVRDHEDSWLVAKFVAMRDRDFWEGELGCPVCEARYPVRNGVVYFSPMRPRPSRSSAIVSSDNTFSLAAMLDLSAPERTIVLCDSWGEFASVLGDISEPHIFVVNGKPQTDPSECIHDVVSERAIPLGVASVDAVAIDAGCTADMIRSAVDVLRDGGRLVAQSGMEVPADILLLASDDKQWVGQKRGKFIPLRRASR